MFGVRQGDYVRGLEGCMAIKKQAKIDRKTGRHAH